MVEANKGFKRERIGRITVERVSKGYLRLRWTLSKQTYTINKGQYSKDNLKACQALAREIDSDIAFNRFDPTLSKYKDATANAQLPELAVIGQSRQIPLRQLWDKFLEVRLTGLKAKTKREYKAFTLLLDKLPKLTYDASYVKKQLLTVSTKDQTRRVLLYLSACCDWGVQNNVIEFNPFKGVHKQIQVVKELTERDCYAFSDEQITAILTAFSNDRYSSHYLPLVKFWLKTGTRPSEGISLKWKNILGECDRIYLEGSIQLIDGKQVWSEGSKNNCKRYFNCSNELKQLLLELRASSHCKLDDYVFPSPRGNAINYDNFLKRHWHKIVDPIVGFSTTPYNCRDTFITNQILKGVPTVIIAKWCDTSVKMIEQRYADKLKLATIRPVD